jgi:hypothetical protein
MSFSLQTMACRAIPEKTKNPVQESTWTGLDAITAIHGRLSAQVALLQGLILPAAKKHNTNFEHCQEQ